ncbi:MAG: hypothetical protein DMG96_16740 [Acidobacteria bacterium]|nr:MAG: hypothetical protein DMG96_16740 [Acidobacteriota bacterium]
MNRSALISAAEDVLHQGCALLDNVDDESYSRKEEGPWGSSIGAHYRHVLDHFLCLIEGLWDGEINYDHRSRSRDIETSIEAARLATNNMIEALAAIPADVLKQECTVIYSVGYDHKEAQPVGSVVARELMFCVGHAIHHYAIMKLLCSARSVALPCEFGIAPSTLKYQEAQAAR